MDEQDIYNLRKVRNIHYNVDKGEMTAACYNAVKEWPGDGCGHVVFAGSCQLHGIIM